LLGSPCPHCGKEVTLTQIFLKNVSPCPHCNRKVSMATSSRLVWLTPVIVFMLLSRNPNLEHISTIVLAAASVWFVAYPLLIGFKLILRD